MISINSKTGLTIKVTHFRRENFHKVESGLPKVFGLKVNKFGIVRGEENG